MWTCQPLKMKEPCAFKTQGPDCLLAQHYIAEEWSHQ